MYLHKNILCFQQTSAIKRDLNHIKNLTLGDLTDDPIFSKVNIVL